MAFTIKVNGRTHRVDVDGDKVKAYPPGSVIVLPGGTYHFHWAKSGEYVTQVSAIGPLGLEYRDPGDDPRQVGHGRKGPAKNRRQSSKERRRESE